ncbi:MAG: hypothetical protein K8Q91_02115 [Candidatus Vogelbacteria bacterium]|nr:hypothetical protein [Candidatus Vogelbacteria bacterium]
MDFGFLHLVSLIITVPVILYADHMGFQYFTGRKLVLDRKKVEWSHWLVMLGISLLIITGVAVMVPMWAVILTKPLFYAKLAFVSTLLINGIFISQLMRKATITPYIELSKEERRLLLLSGMLSGGGWVASVLIGFFGL